MRNLSLLQHATKVGRSGRTFVAWMYQSAAKLKKLKYFTRLTQSFCSDLYWWHTFIVNCNGLCILRKPDHTSHVNFRVFTDASGSWGCGAQWERCWCQWQWPHPIGIMAKELVPIVISCAVWGSSFAHKTVLFLCDNISVVTVVAKGYYSRDKTVLHLLRSLWFFAAIFDINIVSQHIPSVVNIPADMLSRNNLTQFFFSQSPFDPITTSTPVHCVSTETRLDLPLLQKMVHRYYHHGISPATHVTYSCGQQYYLTFCSGIHQQSTPLPTTESALILFATHLTTLGLSCTTLKYTSQPFVTCILQRDIIRFIINNLYHVSSRFLKGFKRHRLPLSHHASGCQ